MDKLDRIQQLHQLLISHRHPVKLRTIAERLLCSEKNARRLIDATQDFMRRPIAFDTASRGWAYSGDEPQGWQMPGLWLTAEELQSMAILLHLLDNFSNGLLNAEIKVVEHAVHKLLEARNINALELAQRIKIIPIANRALPNELFLKVAEALLRNAQLHFRYTDYDGKSSVRTVSPQAMVYYRDNWYLDAWCHRKHALRIFAVARIDCILGIEGVAESIPSRERDAHFSAGYGIFAGQAKQSATLRFRGEASREVAMQLWHPGQRGFWDGEDYVLSFPYSDERELVRDILRFVPDVVVETPAALRHAVLQRLEDGLARFGNH